MSSYATDALDGKPVHINIWLKTKHLRKYPTCELCRGKLGIRAKHSTDKSAHFSHPPKSNCITIAKNRVPYSHLYSVPSDPNQVAKIKQDILNNLHRIFNKCCDLIENLSFDEFNEMMDKAHKLRIWGYVGLDMEYIPYILTTCKEYFVVNKPYRKDTLYFTFAGITRVDGLWIHGQQSQMLYEINKRTTDNKAISMNFNLSSYKNTSSLSAYRVTEILKKLT